MVGAEPVLGELPDDVRRRLEHAIERDAGPGDARQERRHSADALRAGPVVIEAARGGPDGATMPLPSPLGIPRTRSSVLSDEILARASILYVWVTPEESRRKNHERTDPNDPGSILHHGVPMAVMMGDYGCDDMDWLIHHSGRPDAVTRVETRGKTFHLPIARFDNRVDKTTFVRATASSGTRKDVEALHAGLAESLGRLARAFRGARESPEQGAAQQLGSPS